MAETPNLKLPIPTICLPTFPFHRLPAELRLEIWRHASHLPRTIPAVCIHPPTPDSQPTVHDKPSPALLATNHEARKVALSHATTRPYNSTTDIYYVPSSRISLFTKHCLNDNFPSTFPHVSHLAVDSPLSPSQIRSLSQALSKLPSLKTISLVDHTRREVWSGPRTRLRRLVSLADCPERTIATPPFLTSTPTNRAYMRAIRGYYASIVPLRLDGMRSRGANFPWRRSGAGSMGWGTGAPTARDRRALQTPYYSEETGFVELVPRGRFDVESRELERRKERSLRDELAWLEWELNKAVLGHYLLVWCWDAEEGGLRLEYEVRRFAW